MNPNSSIKEDDKKARKEEDTVKEQKVWKSSSGSWACWFASQPHSVTALSSGYRYRRRRKRGRKTKRSVRDEEEKRSERKRRE